MKPRIYTDDEQAEIGRKGAGGARLVADHRAAVATSPPT